MAPTRALSWSQACDVLLTMLGRAPNLVLIDGPSGSGKSTLAGLLHEQALAALPQVELLRLDDVYPGWDGLEEGAHDVAANVVAPLAKGRPGRWRRYDWEAGTRSEQIEIPAGTALIVEGVGALHPRSAWLASGRAWVTADQDTRRTRALTRDGDTYRPHWQRWANQESSYIRATLPAARADLILDTTTLNRITHV